MTDEIKTLRAENKMLRRTVESMTASAARKKVPSLTRVKARSRKDDTIRVIIPDSHGSSIDQTAERVFLADLRRLDPDQIVMTGDHVDCGGFLAAHHTLGFIAETTYTYEDDLGWANRFLDGVQAEAPRCREIHYLEGNHEERIERWCIDKCLGKSQDAEMLRRAFAPEFKLNLRERGIRYYRRSQRYGTSLHGTIKLGKCHFTHGTSTAKMAASVMSSQFGANVVFGHTHRADAYIATPVGLGTIGAWNPGCLCKLQPLWQHARPTSWTHGYAVQIVARSGNFLHINVPIAGGVSLLNGLL